MTLTSTRNSAMAALAGLLLAIPTFYFMLVALLKYELNKPYLFDSIAPSLERWGIKENIGWNINLLILFGPVLALLLNLAVILRIQFENTKDHFDCRVTIFKQWLNLAVVFFAGAILGLLGLYLAGENCSC